MTAAAGLLHVAQPSLSQQIRGLERLCRRGVLDLALMAACEQGSCRQGRFKIVM